MIGQGVTPNMSARTRTIPTPNFTRGTSTQVVAETCPAEETSRVEETGISEQPNKTRKPRVKPDGWVSKNEGLKEVYAFVTQECYVRIKEEAKAAGSPINHFVGGILMSHLEEE